MTPDPFTRAQSSAMSTDPSAVSKRPSFVRFVGVAVVSGLALLFALIVWMNVRLYSVPEGATRPGKISEDAMPQLRNIGRRLRAGEGARMQQIFPEGWFFSHALYGFAWVNVGLQSDDAALKREAAKEARWVLERMDSPEALAPFLADTQVKHGVFYLGWKNRLLGGLLTMLPPEQRLPGEIASFRSHSDQLAAAFRATPTLHLDAYPGRAWPCDNVMALASLKMHDALFGSRHQEIIDAWIEFTRQHLDPATGMIVHQIDGRTGAMLIPARASTQVYIHAFLPELSVDFAREHYAKFRAAFVSDWFGYLPVREYPHGISGRGDVDTGPLILGISPSATTVSIAAARANGDYELSERNVILSETIGIPWTSGGEKSFALGQIIVADAFLVWGKTLVPWSRVPVAEYPASTPAWWRWRIHGSSIVLIAVPAILWRWRSLRSGRARP